MGFLPHTRDLGTYPAGSRRVWLLVAATLANLMCSFEGQTAPVLPLLLSELNMSLTLWGMMSAASALVGAVAGVVAGRWCDKVGRVRILVPAMFITTAACFSIALATSPGELFVFRILQNFSEGFAVATTAPLIRDYSPRMGRAFAYGVWTWGPVGANFMGSAIAATTLPMFDNAWQSQFVLQGSISLVLAVLISLTIRDLSPELRAQIIADAEIAKAAARAAAAHPQGDAPATRPRFRELARYPHIWIHCVAISIWLVFYLTITQYGQVILNSEFGLSPAEASEVMAAFWVLDLLTLLIIGWASDRLQLRKPFSLIGTAAAAILVLYFAGLIGEDVSKTHLMITGALIGIALAVAYGPWMANFSENAEDVEPRLQGTAWGMYRMSTGVIGIALAFIVPAVVEASGNEWRPWLLISGVCQALFIPLMFFFKGSWRRSAAQRATQNLRRRTVAAVESSAAATSDSRTPAGRTDGDRVG